MNARRSPLAHTLALSVVAALALLASASEVRAATCAGLSGGARSACRQYCERLECQLGTNDSRCTNLASRFMRFTGACQVPCECGNGVTSGCEQCDDGNASDADSCTSQCTVSFCGDGVVQSGVEECDDGNGQNTDDCKTDCTLPTCGDGIVRSGVEQCDDANASDDDDCKNNCTLNVCGDGVVRTGVEDCDDGNGSSNDACKNDCTSNVCGDGVVRTGAEACDDGNDSDNDPCKNDCSENFCGDGVVSYASEECDDSNPFDDDECKTDCSLNVCNDGSIWTGVEECEDFNNDNRDSCKNDCTLNVCGDAEIYTGVEICDGGIGNTEDACTDDCQRPGVVSPVLEDFSYCQEHITDHFLLSVQVGELVEVSADTVDAETASDLCFEIRCSGANDYSGDDEVACTFQGPGTSACPSVSFTVQAEGTCEIIVQVCEDLCLDPNIGHYELNVIRSGQDAEMIFDNDDN